MSAWEDVGSTYVDSITSALPLHRLMLSATAFLGALAISHQTHLSIAETIISIEVSQLVDAKSALLQKVKVADIIFGLMLPMIAWIITYSITRTIFRLIARGTNLNARSTSVIEKYPEIKKMDLKDRREEIEILDRSLDKVRGQLKKLNSICEVFCGLSFIFIFASIWGNILDILLGVLFIILAIFLIGLTLNFFLREYYGTALFIAQLQGKAPPGPL